MKKILLALLPFWTPQIPPLGIACLKTFLAKHGYDVKTLDANTEENYRKIYYRYFDILKEHIPIDKRGNIYYIGHDLLRNHMMAHLNSKNGENCLELLKILIYHSFYVDIGMTQLRELEKTLTDFYTYFENWFLNILAKEKPGILGLSVFEDSLPASLFAFRLARKHYTHIETVMGGGVFATILAPGSPNLEFFLEKTIDYIDKIIIGEGELLFYKYLRNQLDPTQRVYTLKDIGGQILDITKTDIPDFSDFNLPNYPYLPAFSSRSCPFSCSFCTETVQWGEYRKKGSTQIVQELTALYKKHGRQLFYMCDSLLNPTISNFAKELLQSDTAIYWDGYLRAEKQACDPDNILLWRRGGFYRTWLGLESGSPNVLELMNKKITVDRIRKVVSGLANVGTKTSTLWLMGFPGEREEDFQQTLALIEELKDDIYEVWCSPFTYYLTGQVKSGSWAEKSRLLYPVEAKDLLIVQSWTLDLEPARETVYSRMNRFLKHCSELGIPSPVSMADIYKADKRWQELHQDAVPAVADFKMSGAYIDECKYVQPHTLLKKTIQDVGDFAF